MATEGTYPIPDPGDKDGLAAEWDDIHELYRLLRDLENVAGGAPGDAFQIQGMLSISGGVNAFVGADSIDATVAPDHADWPQGISHMKVDGGAVGYPSTTGILFSVRRGTTATDHFHQEFWNNENPPRRWYRYTHDVLGSRQWSNWIEIVTDISPGQRAMPTHRRTNVADLNTFPTASLAPLIITSSGNEFTADCIASPLWNPGDLEPGNVEVNCRAVVQLDNVQPGTTVYLRLELGRNDPGSELFPTQIYEWRTTASPGTTLLPLEIEVRNYPTQIDQLLNPGLGAGTPRMTAALWGQAFSTGPVNAKWAEIALEVLRR